MKYLKNPFLPFAILLIILVVFGYRSFFDGKYTKTEKYIFGHNYHQNLELRYKYVGLAQRSHDKARRYIREIGGVESNQCIETANSSLEEKTKKLRQVYEDIQLKYFEEPRVLLRELELLELEGEKYKTPKFPPKVPNPKIVIAINEYIQKVSKIDSSLASYYDNFIFEEGKTNDELNDFYFDTDDYLRAFHYSRFEVQFARMFYKDAEQINRAYFFYPFYVKIEDTKVIPCIDYARKGNLAEGKYSIKTINTLPFDLQNAHLVYPKNVETRFDENGLLVIPKEFQKGIQLFRVAVPQNECSKDTVLQINIDFSYTNNYYKNEK